MQLTPEQIEKMRAIGLRLDRAGTFWQEGTPVTHARLRQALLRWLDVRDDGRDIVRLDAKRYAYVDVEDAHLRARSARWDGDRCFDPVGRRSGDRARLRVAPPGRRSRALRHACGRLRGRIAGPAYHAIAERITESGGSFVLVAANARWPIAR